MKITTKTTLLSLILFAFTMPTASATDYQLPPSNGSDENLSDVINSVCQQNPLCNNAISGMWALQERGNTCYCNEGNCATENTDTSPSDQVSNQDNGDLLPAAIDVNLFPNLSNNDNNIEPFGYTDCSGFITYLLNITNGYDAAYNEINDGFETVTASNPVYGSYVKAFYYYHFFKTSAQNTDGSTATNWDIVHNNGVADFDNVQAGDIVAYCIDYGTIDGVNYNFCPQDDSFPTKLGGHDTGHIMLLLAADTIDQSDISDSIPDAFKDDKYEVTYYRTAVIDASSVHHSNGEGFKVNNGNDTLNVFDSRFQYGSPDITLTAQNCATGSGGGIGSGVVHIAKVEDTTTEEIYWSVLFNHKNKTKMFPVPRGVGKADSSKKIYNIMIGRAKI